MGLRGPEPSGKLSVVETKRRVAPKAPSWLGPWGREAWKSAWKNRSFDDEQQQLLELYCHTYQEFHEAREQWESEGSVRSVPAGNGGERLNPLVEDMRASKKQCKDLGSKLGFFDRTAKEEAPAAAPSKRRMFGG